MHQSAFLCGVNISHAHCYISSPSIILSAEDCFMHTFYGHCDFLQHVCKTPLMHCGIDTGPSDVSFDICCWNVGSGSFGSCRPLGGCSADRARFGTFRRWESGEFGIPVIALGSLWAFSQFGGVTCVTGGESRARLSQKNIEWV